MTDDAAFLRTIKAAPDDDGPQRVYADWLEERGEILRAEEIRRHVRSRLNEEQWELIRAAAKDLFHELYEGTGISIGGFTYYIQDGPSLKIAGERLFETLQKKADDQITTRHGKIFWNDRWLRKKWEKVFKRAFREVQDAYGHWRLIVVLAKRIRVMIRARILLKTISTNATHLASQADDLILADACGADDYLLVDPDTIPNVKALVREAVTTFDPWVFDWSRVRHLQPKVRRNMAAAGFRFGAVSEAQPLPART